jgi:hypothetical protein
MRPNVERQGCVDRAKAVGPRSPVERAAQFRSPAALAAVLHGSGHLLVAKLRAGGTGGNAAEQELAFLDALPGLTRRRLIAMFGTITLQLGPAKEPPHG